MAYGRKSTSFRYYTKRSFKRYGKKYNRKRFKKKRYYQNNVNTLTMKAPLVSRMLRVKLPWIKTFSTNIAVSGTQSYAFQGNAIVPYTAAGVSGVNQPATGDTLPAGEVEYSHFYDRYVINGSSIKIEVVNTNGQAQGVTPLVRAVLLSVPVNGDNDDLWDDVKAQLDGYSYEDLLAWPYAKWRMLGSNTGGSSRLIFKMFRKTKRLTGVKDLRDNNNYVGNLTDGITMVTSNNTNPYCGFMYYLRFFNANTTLTAPLEVTVRMLLYVTMFGREFNPLQTITEF